MCATMDLAALGATGSPKHKVENLLIIISDYLEEIAGMQAVICLRPESAPPADTDAVSETLVRLQTKLSNILSKNKTHLMEPIHDEVLFQVKRIQTDSLAKLRSYVEWLVRTEEEELNKQRWRTRANVTLQESKVDLPNPTAARQLRQGRERPTLAPLMIPGSSSSITSSRSSSRSPSYTQQSQQQSRQQRTHKYNQQYAEYDQYSNGQHYSHYDQRQQLTAAQRTIVYNEEAAARRARANYASATQNKPSRLPVPVKPNTELILIGWIQGDEPSGAALASVYDPTELSMPAMPPVDVGFNPSRPLRLPSWGDAPVCI